MIISRSVTITLDGEAHQVPEAITIIQAMWHLGRSMEKNIGCLGGACGACVVITRLPGQMLPLTGLACQMMVAEGLNISFLQGDPSQKTVAPLPAESPSRETVFQYYPETKRCVACGACTTACPQKIDVMAGVREMMMGDLAVVAERFTTCVSCDLCAAVCESRIRPYRMGLYARRLAGAFHPQKPLQLLNRIEEIASDKFRTEWENVMQVGKNV
ncbi:hypothetical protein MNBD_NITROSPIRAE01-1315 [hydrothermal vent metagenome]|uniref:Ferredoxin n=1 Tax=hydrothermal vent metagenome TaxID=652676 RepID=A0A3B1CJ02_9ZZZZ